MFDFYLITAKVNRRRDPCISMSQGHPPHLTHFFTDIDAAKAY